MRNLASPHIITGPPRRPARRAGVAIAVVVSAAVIGACGSSGTKTTAAAAGGRFLAFSQCMRSHGVPNFPDPSSGGGLSINIGAGLNPASPAFKTAQSACSKLLPGGGPGAGPPSAQAKAQMLAVSECMRAHGVTGFPDPTTGPPASPSGYSQVIGRGDVFIAVPDTIDASSPVYRRAASACRFGIPPGAKTSPAP
jgi:hypothetical protein